MRIGGVAVAFSLEETAMLEPRPARRQPQTGREIEDVKPGAPPRSTTEPDGSEGSSATPKTDTDPETGAPQSDGAKSNTG